MRRTLTTVTGPAAEPVTLDEAKQWARIDAADEDGYLAALLTAAIQAAEQYLRRALISQTLKLALDLDACSDDLGEGVYDLPVTALYGGLPPVVELPMRPVGSISAVVTYDVDDASSTFAASNYSLNNDRLVLAYGAAWPSNMRQYGACEITYVAGYGATGSSVPQPIKSAILMHFQRMYDERVVCDLPPSCENLLRQYRVLA